MFVEMPRSQITHHIFSRREDLAKIGVERKTSNKGMNYQNCAEQECCRKFVVRRVFQRVLGLLVKTGLSGRTGSSSLMLQCHPDASEQQDEQHPVVPRRTDIQEERESDKTEGSEDVATIESEKPFTIALRCKSDRVHQAIDIETHIWRRYQFNEPLLCFSNRGRSTPVTVTSGASEVQIGITRCQLPPGEYRMSISIFDEGGRCLDNVRSLLFSVTGATLRSEDLEPEQYTVVLEVNELLLLGTSMGGARPKAVVEDDLGLWVAKFGRPDDRWNNPRVECAMLELARSCGINSARCKIERVGGKDVLLVQRFDREKTSRGYVRARMISGLTLLRAEESALHRERWSYVLMAEDMRRIVAEPRKDASELFRRMCFNALISNIDDHPRNHSLIAFDQDWRLSPAYDLTPSPSVSQERDLSLVCGDWGRSATVRNVVSQASRFLLDEQEARAIVSSISNQVRTTWYSALRTHGVSKRDAESIKSAFAYDGFEL